MPEYAQWTLVALGVLLFVWMASGRTGEGDEELARIPHRRRRARNWRPYGGLPVAIRDRVRAGKTTIHPRRRAVVRGRLPSGWHQIGSARRRGGAGVEAAPQVALSWSSGGTIERPLLPDVRGAGGKPADMSTGTRARISAGPP